MIFLLLLVAVSALYFPLFGSGDWRQIHENYIRSQGQGIAKIFNSEGAGATGFIARGRSSTNFLITNGHVCNLAVNGQLFADYREDKFLLKVIKQYPFNDLCAIEAPSGAFPLSIAKSAQSGQIIHIVGHPLLEPLSNVSGELSGLVELDIPLGANLKAKDCFGPTYKLIPAPPILGFFGVNTFCIRHLEAVASNASILPGNSGSPVLNNYAQVVGVAFASNEGVRSYIVPLTYLKDFLNGL